METFMPNVSIISVGGTIDKIYFDANSEYEVGPPNIEKVLAELNLAITYRINSLMRKDSLDLTDTDRSLIATTVASDPCPRILITHGTDTMVETAKALRAVSGKTIVLTGALEPALFKTSDAVFNIGCAIGAVQVLPAGVYIAMNGKIFPEGKVRKNVLLGRFEDVEE
jgi:L-asparaginase